MLNSFLRHTVYAALVAVLAAVVCSCDNDITYSTSPADRLEFSCDTLDFDSVFAGKASATGMLKAYNPGNCALRLSVMLQDGSHFQLVADGQDGTRVDGLEVAPCDSLICFVRALPLAGSVDPTLELADSICFMLENGTCQFVQLRVTQVNARQWTGVSVTENMKMDASLPYLIYDSLYVAPGVCLEMAPGTRLFMHNGAFLKVDGRLLAVGTEDSLIVIGGDRMDCLMEGLPYSLLDAQWKGVILGADSYGNRLEHCVIRSGEFGLRADSTNMSVPKLELVSSVVHNVTGSCIENRGGWMSIVNSQLTNGGDCCLDCRGGRVEALFSTFASLSVWNLGTAAVRVSGIDRQPIIGRTVLRDCVITGRHDNELLVLDSIAQLCPDSLLIANSLVLTKDSVHPYFSGVVFENTHMERYGAANFKDGSRRDEYDCVFELDSLSRARGLADSLSIVFQHDLDGRCRPATGADAGCLQSTFADAAQSQKKSDYSLQ